MIVGGAPGRAYYVGETDSLGLRLEAHRSRLASYQSAVQRRTGKKIAGNTCVLGVGDCIVLGVSEGKSRARAAESRLIAALSKSGLTLLSMVDIAHSNFGPF